jgi:hypothetical protein
VVMATDLSAVRPLEMSDCFIKLRRVVPSNQF